MNQPATPASRDPLLATLLAQITSHQPDADGQLISRAYQAAAHWHHGQQRKSGDPYLHLSASGGRDPGRTGRG